MKHFALLILAIALTACSNTGNPYGDGAGQAAKPGHPGAPAGDQDQTEVHTGGPNTSLMGNAWCVSMNQQGRDYQVRLNFINVEDYDLRYFMLTPAGRGDEIESASSHGNYQLNGASLSLLDSRGTTATYTVRLDPADAVTGAKKLHLTNQQGDVAFDPCN